MGKKARLKRMGAVQDGVPNDCQRARDMLTETINRPPSRAGPETPLESLAELEAIVTEDAAWDIYFARYILPLKAADATRCRTRGEGITGSRRMFQTWRTIEARLPYCEAALRVRIAEWNLGFDERSRGYFEEVRRRRLTARALRQVEPAWWLLAAGAGLALTSPQPALEVAAAGAAVAVAGQQLWGVLRHLNIRDRLHFARNEYAEHAMSAAGAIGAACVERHKDLVGLFGEVINAAVQAEARHYDPASQARALEIEGRWLDIAGLLRARIRAFAVARSVNADINALFFRDALSHADYRGHYFARSVPIRSLPRAFVDFLWNAGLIAGAAATAMGIAAAGLHQGLAALPVISTFALAGAGLTVFAGALRPDLQASAIDWPFAEAQLAAAEPTPPEDPDDFYHEHIKRYSRQKAEWQRKTRSGPWG